jgi:hypothetical protein
MSRADTTGNWRGAENWHVRGLSSIRRGRYCPCDETGSASADGQTAVILGGFWVDLEKKRWP